MTIPEDDETDTQLLAFFRPLSAYGRVIWLLTLAVTVGTIVAAGAYYWAQPIRWTAALGFRPVFAGVDVGEYPNKTKFGPGDITDPTVVDQVFDKNQVKDYCSREEFRSSFVVTESSSELQFLDFEYQARLSDARISVVERQRLQDEYQVRRTAAAVAYQLTFVRSAACYRLPPIIVSKALVEVLETWATDADTKRGVLKVRVGILTPSIFDIRDVGRQSLLVRADLIRSTLTRLIANVEDVQKIPGAELIQVGEHHTSLIEVRARLADLVQANLDPLIAVAGRGLGRESVQWVDQALQVATVQYQAAQEQTDAYRNALQVYSGEMGTSSVSAPGGQKPQSSSDVQSLTPQIDRTFIDRIVELQAANTTFRQFMTRQMVDASLAAVQYGSTVAHYKQLLASLKGGVESPLTSDEVSQRLDTLVIEGKDLARLFDEIYEEFSRVSLRSGALMYHIERPVEISTLQSFSLRDYVFVVLGTLFVTPLLLAIGCLTYHRFRQVAAGPVRP